MKRYNKYKDSGIPRIGEVPQHWEVKRLKQVASCNDESLSGTTPNNYKIKYVEISDVNEMEGIMNTTEYSFERAPSRARRVTKVDDIIISTVRTYLKAVARITEPKLIVSTGFAVLRARQSINKLFLSYIIQSSGFIDEVIATSVGINYPAITANKLTSLSIPLPPLPEQEAIVVYLEGKVSLIDELVKKQETQIALLRELKQSIIAKAVAQGIDKDVTLRPSGIPWIGEIPEHWEVKKLRSFVTLFSEKGHSDKTLLSVTRDNGVIVRDIESKDENHNFIPTDLSGYKLIHSGDFVINKMKAWQGAYAVSEYQGIVSPAYYTCKLSFPNKEFFNIAIRSKAYIPFFTQYSKGIRVDQWDLSPNSLKEIPFFLPPLPEQEAIVAYISRKTSEIDKLIAKQEAQITQLRELKQTLIADAVTGRINVQPS